MAETAENDGGGVAQVGLAAIFAAFFRLGCTAFGGGTAGWIHREVVLRQRWVDDRTFLAALGVGQALPGANGIKAAVLIGMRLHGIVGALCAFVALLAGPLAIVIALAAAYGGLGGQSLTHAVLDGVAAAAIGLTFATGIGSVVRGAPGLASYAIAGATVLCVGVLRWPILPVILGLAPLSIALILWRERR